MIEIRPPQPAEIEEIANLWVRSFNPARSRSPGTERMSGQLMMRVGKYSNRGVGPNVWSKAHRLWVLERLDKDPVLVAALGDGMAGFIVFSLPTPKREAMTVHYLYVLRQGRRHGIGTRLYRAARIYGGDAPVVITHTTRYWTQFAEAMH